MAASEVYSVLAWLGDIDRFELVKTLRMASPPCSVTDSCGSVAGVAGTGREDVELLSKSAITACVRLMEAAEVDMCSGDSDSALDRLAMVLAEAPNCVHALYRYGLLSLLKDAQRRIADTRRQASAESHATRMASPRAAPSLQTTTALRAAVQLEPTNRALRKNVELALRIFSGSECDAVMFSQAHAPKSSGDVRILTELALLHPHASSELNRSRRQAILQATESRVAMTGDGSCRGDAKGV